MARIRSTQSLTITIAKFEPANKAAWQQADSARRKAWYGYVGEAAAATMRSKLLAGRGRNGRRLLVRLEPREDGADGPPLSPHGEESRTVKLLRSRAYSTKAVLFWIGGWGEILAYHQAGIPSRGGLRVRDVGGFTQKELDAIRKAATAKWITAAQAFGAAVGGLVQPSELGVTSTSNNTLPKAPKPRKPKPPKPAVANPAEQPPTETQLATQPAQPSPEQLQPAEQSDRFGPSKAKVRFDADVKSKDALKLAREILGRDITAQDFANLVGAPDDAEVIVERVDNDPIRRSIKIKIKGPGFIAERKLVSGFRGSSAIVNEFFEIRDQSKKGGDIAINLLGRQIEQARKLGVSELQTYAAGQGKRYGGSDLNGYYTWARFGYDNELSEVDFVGDEPRKAQAELAVKFPNARRISDLMATQEGRDWWKHNGRQTGMTFDLDPDEDNVKTFKAYVAERDAKKAAPSLEQNKPQADKPQPTKRQIQVSEQLKSRAEPAKPIQGPGMAKPETLQKVNLNGWEIYAPNFEPHSAAAATIADLAKHLKDLPPKLKDSTKVIIFSDQANKNDEYWAKEYNMPGARTAANAGGGIITVWNSNPQPAPVMIHEMGHNLAGKEYGKVKPPPESEFGKANAGNEPKPSKYAEQNVAEDFAESVKFYTVDRDNFRKNHPERFKAIDGIFKPDP